MINGGGYLVAYISCFPKFCCDIFEKGKKRKSAS